MIMGYLFMTYVAVVACWPVSLILLLALAAILLHVDRRILRVSIIALVGFLAFAIWQFGTRTHDTSTLLSDGVAWLSEQISE
ncbi:hypothetical protein MXL87_08295 [Klebsiella variicola]|uniref:hypothetical protein n=1 Tax=Klebsiella variicola TaxID=244366 RepID=UPI002DBB4CCB|nr:hypothetical protein [Klebsiella variicola]MEB6354979.1 hypothetical protein [Klebsiella variicola]